MNAYDGPITVSVYFSDGRATTYAWQRCDAALLGSEAEEIAKVVIERNGAVVRQFDADEIRKMLAREKAAKGEPVWRLSNEGVTLEDYNDARCSEIK
jgi:hypothetical protein